MNCPKWLLCQVMVVVAHRGTSTFGASGSAGLGTTFTPTADTVFVRVDGVPKEAAMHRLIEERRIAPGAEDTTLFTDVSDVEVDRSGRIWVYDRPTNSIFLFGASGQLIRRIGRQGAGPGEFKGTSGMVALGDSGLAIWDGQNARISFFTAGGDFKGSWRVPAGFSTTQGLFTDRSGALFMKRPVTAPREGEILGTMGLVRLKAGGGFGDSLAPPDMPVPREVYVAEHVGKDGSRGRSSTNSQLAPGYFWGWHPAGYFVVAHGGHSEIVLARPHAEPLAIVRRLPPVAIAGEEREEERAKILWSMRRTDPGWSWTGPPIPDRKAPLLGLFVARDGRIWAQVGVPSERIPEDELAVPRDKTMPISHFRTPPVWEGFGADGAFFGRVAFPARSRLIEAEGDKVWLLMRDENDLPAIVRFRMK